MTDITRALLGDHYAAERLTSFGVLIPCPVCKGRATLYFWRNEKKRQNPSNVKCSTCGLQTRTYLKKKRAIRAWNTRAPILSESDLEILEGTDRDE